MTTENRTQQEIDNPHIVTDPKTGQKTHYLGQAKVKIDLPESEQKKPEAK